MKSETTTFRLAIFRKENGPLSKTIALDDEGKPVSDGSYCKMSSGMGCNTPVVGLSGLSELINSLETENALALGTFLDQGDSEVVEITTKDRVETADAAIARTKDHMAFAEGQPGFLLIDFDQKGMPETVKQRLQEAGGVWEAICGVFPEFRDAGILRRASTSAGLRNEENGEEFGGSGGEHIYVAVRDSFDIPRATKVLHQRLWFAGLGWIHIGKIGQKLERSIVDQSVGSPERLVFEGPPVLEPPLTQSAEARRPIVIEGDVIDTRVAIPDLTPQERARFEAVLMEQKRQLEPEAAKLRDHEDDRLSRKLADKTGIELDTARKQIARRHNGDLLPLHPLEFDDASLGEVSVGDVLVNPDRFVGQTLADPLEGVSYGRNKAKVYRRRDGSLWINSFAHGGAQYELKHDSGSLRAMIEGMSETMALDDFISALAAAVLEAGEEQALLRAAKQATGVNIGELRDRLKSARLSAVSRERNNGNMDPIDDARVRLPAPARNAELTPTLRRIDQVMCSVDASVPPFRNLDHKLAKVTRRPLTSLHQLGSGGETPYAAPPQATLKVADDAETIMMIEEHAQFMVAQEEGGKGQEYPVRLEMPFVSAYAKWEGSKLPRVSGISTLPIVLPGGELKSGAGLDHQLGLIFEVDPLLLKALGDLEPVSLEDAKAAYEWLRNEWLVDVDTDDEGKAIIIAMALTIIERHLLPERPAFFLTAAQRGSGKTTALHMISTAITGSMASAASWSFKDEERRKGVFSYLREGAAMVVYDNVPRGSALGCSTIERALTSPELSDRVLRESRTETVPTSTVIAFTGNNITPKGDLASRSLVAHLTTDRTDPENRDFIHEEPMAWTTTHRLEILRRLYILLMLDRAKPNRAKTRFKTWWLLIGHPIELVSGVDFEELFRKNDQFDEEAQGATEFIAMMVKHLDRDGEFTAAHVVKLIEHPSWGGGAITSGPRPDPDALKSALEEASGRPFSGDNVSAHRVARKLKSIVDRPVEVDGVLLHLVVKKEHEGHRYSIKEL